MESLFSFIVLCIPFKFYSLTFPKKYFNLLLGGVYYQKSFKGLLMHTGGAQYGTFQRNVLYCMCVFCMYIVWCQLTHLHEHWRCFMEYYFPNSRRLKVLLTHQLVYWNTLWHDHINVRILPDRKVFTCRMLYIDNIKCYWREICSGVGYILSVTFIILIYLNTNKKRVHTDFHLDKPVQIASNTKREFNIIIRKIGEILRGWSNWNHPIHLMVINRRYRLPGTRGKLPTPRSIEVKSLKTSQEWSPKTIPTSRAGAMN